MLRLQQRRTGKRELDWVHANLDILRQSRARGHGRGRHPEWHEPASRTHAQFGYSRTQYGYEEENDRQAGRHSVTEHGGRAVFGNAAAGAWVAVRPADAELLRNGADLARGNRIWRRSAGAGAARAQWVGHHTSGRQPEALSSKRRDAAVPGAVRHRAEDDRAGGSVARGVTTVRVADRSSIRVRICCEGPRYSQQ